MPRTLSAAEYKELGKRYYGRKDYQAACDAFTEGIAATTEFDSQLYDYRAAAWTKLEKPQNALVDSRSMIKNRKDDPRGYLRTGRILEQEGKLDTALGIYAYGLKNVKVKDLQLLKAAHDTLNRKLSPPTAVDPMSRLPLELAEMVLIYLKFNELVNALRVSKQWKAILTSRPALWTNMDLFISNDRQLAVRPRSVKALIKYSQCKITRARIHRYSDKEGLRLLATTCKALEELHFGNTQFGGDTIIETIMMSKALKTLNVSRAIELELDQVTQIVKYRPTLENLQVDYIKPARYHADWKVDLPAFKSLHLTLHLPLGRLQERYLELLNLIPSHRPGGGANSFLERAPNLKSLHLEGWKSALAPEVDFSGFKSLETLSLQHVYISRPPRLPSSLKNISMNDILSPIAHNQIWRFHSPLPALERLHLDGQAYSFSKIGLMLDGRFEDPTIPNDPSSQQSFRPKNLTSLRIYGPEAQKPHHLISEDENKLIQLLHNDRLSGLKDLALINLFDKDCCVTDTFVDNLGLLSTIKNIETLNLTGSMITGASFRTLIREFPRLGTLVVSDCSSVSPDAIEWVRSKGVTVVDTPIRRDLASKLGGRMVRYG
ncbi:hypothetical protein EG328_011661 [Venturia inaequalis]|uniref:F-box domain-containing protein n=1 Tax=Venturia inaequalis TaxID=5025 RepID=A0A8H3VIH5_VENIN|nr:hypothetical protein EG328_011661 [Venturia inaequalis]